MRQMPGSAGSVRKSVRYVNGGQASGSPDQPTSVPAGSCVEWHTYWNTYDDWGGGTSAGSYRLEAYSLGRSQQPLPAATDSFSL